MIKAESCYGLTDQGLQRQNNEDAFVLQTLSNSLLLACVIDGVGGYEGGEVAAGIAQSIFIGRRPEAFTDPVQKLRDLFADINRDIITARQANQTLSGMACVATAVLADFKANIFYYVHVGDTRLYLYRDSSLIKVTKDQSFVGYLEDSQKISEHEAMTHPKRNEINKALGFEPLLTSQADYFETGSSPFLPGDLLLLCSDGLTDLVTKNDISNVLEEAETVKVAAETLIRKANEAGGKDNITAVLVENTNARVESQKTKPVNTVVDSRVTEERPPTIVTVTKRPVGLVVFLLLLIVAMACTTLYLWKGEKPVISDPVLLQTPSLNPDQKKLIDSLAVSPFVFLDSSGNRTITLTKAIMIEKDSVYLNANGMRFVCDSGMKGPAFIISKNCSDFLLENCVVSGFETGIENNSASLRLRKVVFENCTRSLQQALNLAKQTALSFDITDSSIKKLKSASRLRQ